MMDNKTTNSKKRNILIIEDEGDISLILNLMLKKEAIEIEHVTTLAKAATQLQQQSPDIVIIDNQLPDGLGIEYIKEIKSSHPLIKIIMITGNTDSTDKETALQNGADVFLAKPFTKEQIQTAIESASSLKVA
jgi:two-component system OmpR family response regulator